MARPSKYPFDEALQQVGDTWQVLALDKPDVAKVRNAATQWAIRRKCKVVTRTMKYENPEPNGAQGIVVTVELVPNEVVA